MPVNRLSILKKLELLTHMVWDDDMGYGNDVLVL